MVGAFGVIAGMIAFDALLIVPVHMAFLAVTVNVYDVPFVSPVMVIGLPLPVATNHPTLDVTIYSRIADPPVSADPLNWIVA